MKDYKLLFEILIILVLVLGIIKTSHVVRGIIVVLLLINLVPIGISILQGDGDAYVSKFAGMFNPAIEEQINSGYNSYQDQVKKDPLFILDISDMVEFVHSMTDSVAAP